MFAHRAATISFTELQVWLLIEGGLYSRRYGMHLNYLTRPLVKKGQSLSHFTAALDLIGHGDLVVTAGTFYCMKQNDSGKNSH